MASAPLRVPLPKLRSERKKCQDWHILSYLVLFSGLFDKFKKELGWPEPVDPIPVTKTTQIPLMSMHINQSTVDGNASAMGQMHRCSGIGKDAVKGRPDPVVSMDGFVSLTHGDLGTSE
jgi:hypothetical protein